MYAAFSGKRRARHALIETIAASRAATRSPSSSSSSGSSGEARGEAVERDPRDAEDVLDGPPAQERRERHREVRSERRVAAVAEVEDPAEPIALVEQEVVEVEVPVHDLAAQPLPLRATPAPRSGRAPARRAPGAPGSRDLAEQRTQPRRGAEVPEQLPAGCGVEERAQREAETGVHGGDPAHGVVVELRPALVAVPSARRAGPGGPRTSARGSSSRATGRLGSTAATWAIAASSRSSTASSSREFEILRTAPPAPSSSRNAWSRSLPSARRGAVKAEEVGRDPRGLVRREAWRRRVENGAHGRPIVFGGAWPSAGFRRGAGVQESLIRAKRLPLLREDRSPLRAYLPATVGGYGGTFCGTGRSRQGGRRGGSPHHARRFSVRGPGRRESSHLSSLRRSG